MAEFKPMVKMMTTEPSVELKLKKGGHATMPKAKDGHKAGKKMMDGGVMGALARTPALIGRPAVNAPVRSPGKPSMGMRRKAMMMGLKEGGETSAEHMAEMRKMAKTEKELKKHESMPASKAHKGLKTGGVVMGQGGFKKGGKVKMAEGGKSSIINTEGQGGKYRNTKMDTAEYTGKTSGKTGAVKLGNAGGYKKGGLCYAKGGGVEGNVSTTPPGKTNTKTGGVRLGNAGGFKKGGMTKKAGGCYAEGGMPESKKSGKKSEGQMTEVERQIIRKMPTKRPMPSMEEDITPPIGSPMPPKEIKDLLIRPYKKGGASKKAVGAAKFATGGSVNDSGRPEKMPQGNKRPSTPVSINQLSGTFKKGGKVKK